MLVKDCMTKQVEMGSRNMTLQAVARKMKDGGYGVLPIGEGDKLIGMVTDRDITIRGTADGLIPQLVHVDEVMSKEVLYCFEDETLEEVADRLGDNQIRRLPVLNKEKKLVGILSLGDVTQSDLSSKKIDQTLSEISKN